MGGRPAEYQGQLAGWGGPNLGSFSMQCKGVLGQPDALDFEN